MQFREILKTVLNDKEAALMPTSYDRVGDILITCVPEELAPVQTRIGKILLSLHPSVKVVANRSGVHHGEFRTRPLTVIAGEQRLVTRQRENGINLHIDLDQIYYSVRSAGERLRIASLVKSGEQMAVLCSGAGPFPLVISAHSNAASIIGLEKNPVAHQYAQRNLDANRKIRNVSFLQGDARQAQYLLGQRFDRVVSVLPIDHEPILESAVNILKPGGILHHYVMVKNRNTLTVSDNIRSKLTAAGLIIKEIEIQYCGHCSPGLDRVCFTATTQR